MKLRSALGLLLICLAWLTIDSAFAASKVTRRGFLFGAGAVVVPAVVQVAPPNSNVIEFVYQGVAPLLPADDWLLRMSRNRQPLPQISYGGPADLKHRLLESILRVEEASLRMDLNRSPQLVELPPPELLMSPPGMRPWHYKISAPQLGGEWESRFPVF